MVKPVSFLCFLALVVTPFTAQAQDQNDGDGAAIVESTLSYEGPPDDDPEVTTTIIIRIDRSSAFPQSQLPTTQLPQSQLPQSTAFPAER
jgi:hypothetical protein